MKEHMYVIIIVLCLTTLGKMGYLSTVRAHSGQSNFSFFQQKQKKEISLILIIFTYFKVQKK